MRIQLIGLTKYIIDDSGWWHMKKEDITPRKYSKSKICIYPDVPLDDEYLPNFKIKEAEDYRLIKLYYSNIKDEFFLNVLENYQELRGNQEGSTRCVFANEFGPWDDIYFGKRELGTLLNPQLMEITTNSL